MHHTGKSYPPFPLFFPFPFFIKTTTNFIGGTQFLTVILQLVEKSCTHSKNYWIAKSSNKNLSGHLRSPLIITCCSLLFRLLGLQDDGLYGKTPFRQVIHNLRPCLPTFETVSVHDILHFYIMVDYSEFRKRERLARIKSIKEIISRTVMRFKH